MKARQKISRTKNKRIWKKGAVQKKTNKPKTSSRGGHRL